MLTNKTSIRVESLKKGFGEYPVLRDIDLTVEWGELLVVFGANGSGKTTLLKLLSTQYRPDWGEIWVGGIPRSRDPLNIRKIIGVVGHQPMLYEDLTCQENLWFFEEWQTKPLKNHWFFDIFRKKSKKTFDFLVVWFAIFQKSKVFLCFL